MAIGFFTQGIDFSLPHPKIPQRTILLLCNVIKRAWQLLEKNPPPGFILESAYEDEITRELVEIIENVLRQTGEVIGFNNAMFGRVTRGQEITNYNKEHPDKMPDIFFDLKREHLPVLSSQDGLFVECKPVDKKHYVWSCYCRKGLKRFIIGDYAWAMQDALMIGYTIGPYSFEHLSSVLGAQKSAELNTIEHFRIEELGVYRSNHVRRFEWLENRGNASDISLTHLWLRVRIPCKKATRRAIVYELPSWSLKNSIM